MYYERSIISLLGSVEGEMRKVVANFIMKDLAIFFFLRRMRTLLRSNLYIFAFEIQHSGAVVLKLQPTSDSLEGLVKQFLE